MALLFQGQPFPQQAASGCRPAEPALQFGAPVQILQEITQHLVGGRLQNLLGPVVVPAMFFEELVEFRGEFGQDPVQPVAPFPGVQARLDLRQFLQLQEEFQQKAAGAAQGRGGLAQGILRGQGNGERAVAIAAKGGTDVGEGGPDGRTAEPGRMRPAQDRHFLRLPRPQVQGAAHPLLVVGYAWAAENQFRGGAQQGIVEFPGKFVLAPVSASQDEPPFGRGEQGQRPGRRRQGPGVQAQAKDPGELQAAHLQQPQNLEAGVLDPGAGQRQAFRPLLQPRQQPAGLQGFGPQGGLQFLEQRVEAAPGAAFGSILRAEFPGFPDLFQALAPLPGVAGSLERLPKPVEPGQQVLASGRGVMGDGLL